MQSQHIFTFPFAFQQRPKRRPFLSSLQRGVHGRFGLAIQPIVNFEVTTAICTFFEIDVNTESAAVFEMQLPYLNALEHMEPGYDQSRDTWFIALDPIIYGRPIDIYEISKSVDLPWSQVFSTSPFDETDIAKGYAPTERRLVACWKQDEHYPLVFSEIDPTDRNDVSMYWTDWRNVSLDSPLLHHVNKSYRQFPFVHREGCLLFTLQRFSHDGEKNGFNQSISAEDWGFSCAAYTSDGMEIRQERVPHISIPIRNRELPNADLYTWLTTSMSTATGPKYGLQKERTCIAALVLQDNPEFSRVTSKGPADTVGPQGGLCCLNMRGELLQYDSSLMGIQTSMCTIGEHVVGVTWQDGQWQLWRWNPFAGTDRTISAYLASDIQRVTVVSPDCEEDEQPHWFWCVEEYEHDTKIVQRESNTMQELKSLWCEGVTFWDWWDFSGIADIKATGLLAYRDSLLVLCINSNEQLQLLQFE